MESLFFNQLCQIWLLHDLAMCQRLQGRLLCFHSLNSNKKSRCMGKDKEKVNKKLGIRQSIIYNIFNHWDFKFFKVFSHFTNIRKFWSGTLSWWCSASSKLNSEIIFSTEVNFWTSPVYLFSLTKEPPISNTRLYLSVASMC